MKISTRTVLAAVGTALIACAPLSGQEVMYDLVDIGSLGNGDTVAMGMNDQGQVVGWSQVNDGGLVDIVHAFVWDDGVITDLGTLGGQTAIAFDINNLGHIVGASTTADGEQHAFYAYDGRMWDLNEVPMWTSYSSLSNSLVMPLPVFREALAVNDEGWIVGRGTLFDDTWERAFLLVPAPASGPDHPSYVYFYLGTLPAGGDAIAHGLNGQGEIVGECGGCAFIFDVAAGEMQYLDPEGPLADSSAVDINEAGIAAGWNVPEGASNPTACVWEDGYRIDLSAGVGWMSWANSISDAGVVVGAAESVDEGVHEQRAMMWDGWHLPIDLTDVTDFGPVHKNPWEVLSSASEIDDFGRIIGHGYYKNGVAGAFLLVPHENK